MRIQRFFLLVLSTLVILACKKDSLNQTEWLSKKSLLGKYAANSSSFRFYASVNQLRKESVISYSRPPMAVRMKLEGLTENADHLYRLEDLEQRFNKAISAYDEL